MQHHSLKRNDFLVERKFCARHQRRIKRFFDPDMLDGAQIEVGEEAVEPVRYHALEQRRLVGNETIQRLGGGPVNDLTGFVVGADLGTAPAAPVLGGVYFSHAFT